MRKSQPDLAVPETQSPITGIGLRWPKAVKRRPRRSAVALFRLPRRAEAATALLRGSASARIDDQRALGRVHGTGGQHGKQGSAADDAQDSFQS
jgi:hypothetical protein